MKSPIVARGMRDTSPHAPDRRSRLVVFVLRAYEFWNHPYFRGEAAAVPLRLVFESLAFRLRPIALMDSDDASLWKVLNDLEAETGDTTATSEFRRRYDEWFSVSDEDLKPYWPVSVPWASQPPPGGVLVNWAYAPSPVQELWDRVFGDGPHSDFRRVLSNKAVDWNKGAALGEGWRMARMLSVVTALRPVVVDVHNAVLDVTSGS